MSSQPRVRRMLVAGVILGSLGLSFASAASADTDADALWYLDAIQVSAVHDAGITGEGITIAVFDDEIDPDLPGLQDADIEIRELEGCPAPIAVPYNGTVLEGHGSSVTSLLVGNGTSESGAGPVGVAPGVKILFYGVLNTECPNGTNFTRALDDAVGAGADIVSFSGGTGVLAVGNEAEVASVTAALQAGALIVTALPNEDTTLISTLTTMNGVVNVASFDVASNAAPWPDGTPMTFEDVDVSAPGIDVSGVGWDGTWGTSPWSGNSAATPLVSGVIALAMQKWPDATPNQILQSLIHNTGTAPHDLAWSDTFGYGPVNATRMIEHDPSQYPDENPLFTDDQLPTPDDVYPAPTPEPTAPPATGAGALPWVLGGSTVIIVGIGVSVALLRRKK
ncbi:S8 family peptidase [Microbacterium sp. A196]|uniref:S8 family peptidase n=1 Tax=Microbacterium sp. A196 TaxID=3457320 RepID=UPI003FD5D148